MDGTVTERTIRVRTAAFLVCVALLCVETSAFALSELQQLPPRTGQTTPSTGVNPADGSEAPVEIPMPDPLIGKPAEPPIETEPDAAEPDGPDLPASPVEVLTDVTAIPQSVQRMRTLIIEAASSGDIEKLRPLLGRGETATQVTVSESDEDPVTLLRGSSGDPEGIEILAILLDVITSDFVRLEAGTPDEIFIWPYFAAKPLSSLTPPQKVDLFRVVTAGDFAAMEEFGSYNFYRIGITPDGEWKFFVAGD